MSNLLLEYTTEVKRTRDGGKGGEADILQFVIAGQQETTLNGLKGGHGDVAKRLVAVENQVASLGKVGCTEALKIVAPETELTSEVVEGWDGNAADVAESHVGSSSQVGEFDGQRLVVASEVDQTSALLQLIHVDRLQVRIVCDIEVTDGVEGNSLQGGKASVGDADMTSGRNASSEGQSL